MSSSPPVAQRPTVSGEPRVVVRNLTKVFRTRRGEHVALDNVSLEVAPGEALVLLGPSGCGKTTLLRSVAGLERPDDGEILVHGEVVFSARRKIFRPPEKRRLSMVFQSYALWPHMSVAENISYPLRNLGVPAGEISGRVVQVLELIGLATYGSAFPGQLSGGQQQRVALARAIVANEGLVLFDEPLSNLDAKVRERLRLELMLLQKKFSFSSLYVTHDQSEAMALADRVAVMDMGKISQVGSPDAIYLRPASRYVANFVGSTNEVEGIVVGTEGPHVVADTGLGRLRGRSDTPTVPGQKAAILFRPQHCRVEAASAADSAISGEVERTMFLGTQVDCIVRVADIPLVVALAEGAAVAPGDRINISLSPDRTYVFPAGGAAS